MTKQFTVFMALLLSSVAADAQELPSESVPVDLGVSTEVNTMLQDRTGFIWFSTNSGLYKYDGYSCVPYRHRHEDSTSIASNYPSALHEDSDGFLWVGTGEGIDRFDRVNGTFRHFKLNPLAPENPDSNFVATIWEDERGILWVGGYRGLYQFDKGAERFRNVALDTSGAGGVGYYAVLAIYQKNSRGRLWIGTNIGLQTYDPASGTCKCNLHATDYEIRSILEDDSGILWLGTSSGLKEYNPATGACATYSLKIENRSELFEPSDQMAPLFPSITPGFLWIATTHGIFSFDTGSRTFSRWNDEARAVCIERSGTLLVATRSGVKKIVLRRSPFREIPMGRNTVSAAVLGSGGTLWTFGFGWHKFDMKTERFVPYSFGSDQLYFVYHRVQGGQMAFAKKDGSFCIRDSLGRQIVHLDPRWAGVYGSMSMTHITKKGCYIGTVGGALYHIDLRTGSVSELLNLGQWICWIQEDRSGFLWIATFGGRLGRYDQEKRTFSEFVPDKKNPSSWPGNPVNWLYEDKKGIVWIATSDGLERYDSGAEGFVHYSEASGLLGNNVRGVMGDNRGFLWLSTTKGISKFNPETGSFKIYDASYGFTPSAGGFYGGVLRADNGEMFVGGDVGLIRFHPDSVQDNLFIPPVVITSFRVFDKPVPISNGVHLPYDENFLSLEFAALSYVYPQRNQYKYMMEGIDKDWVYSGTRRFVNYVDLDPGNYIFRVKGSNNEGVWNETGATIAIVISPPWWKTGLAYGFYALFILGGLYGAWRLQERRMRTRHALEMMRFEATKLHEVDELKSRFFANISHEFRTPLTLILGPAKHLLETTEDRQTQEDLGFIHRNASRLLELVNQLLDLAKLESGSMKLQASAENIVPFVKEIMQTFCSYAERKNISLAFAADEDELIVYVDRDKLQKILTNLLSNAFKFTPEAGRIDVRVIRENEHAAIRISDTGIGIPADRIPKIFGRFYQVTGTHARAQEGTGIGLSLCRELIELHKGTITVESEEGRGSTFTVRLPLGKGHLKAEDLCEIWKRDEPVSAPSVAMGEEQTPTDQSARTAKQETGKPVLLIVEDNDDVRHYIRRELEAEYSILEACDGDEGRSIAVEEIPEVIVSDIMMPKMDGYALCSKLKGDERTSHIPIILLTAKAASQDKIEGFETGADDYITKPFEPAELKARIANLLEQRKRLHEHFRRHGLFEVDKEKITPLDQRFLERLSAAITSRMSDPGFGVERLAESMAVSRSLLLKKVEALIGEPPIALIRRTRLNRAARLLEAEFGNVSQVALEVGFSNPSHFTESFRNQFGVNPSDYTKSGDAHQIPASRRSSNSLLPPTDA